MLQENKKLKKSSFFKKIYYAFIIALLTVSCSCKRKIIDGGHPLFIKAQNEYEDGKYIAAAELYKKYLKINPDSAKANFQLGAIYQEEKEYIQAIFYYERYLDLEPNSSDRNVIEQWIISSKKQLLDELEKKYNKKIKPKERENETKLLKELDQLKQKNEKMKEFIIKHKDVLSNTQELNQEQKNNKTEYDEQQVYIVEPGDTYYGISKKVYGTAKYFRHIWEHNKRVNSTQKLRPGEKLIIPVLPTN